MKTFYRLIVTYEIYEGYNELLDRQLDKFPVRKTREEAEADGSGIQEGSREDGRDTYYTSKEVEELEVPID